jgi:hypothetical protein
MAAGNPAHLDRPQSVQISDLAHLIHAERGDRLFQKGNLRHAHALGPNYRRFLGCFEWLKISTAEVQFAVFRKSIIVTECQTKTESEPLFDFVLKVLR